jgi:hypothetical protein
VPAAAPAATSTAHAEEEYVYVDDRVSKLWVALIAGTFVAILLWGLLGGGNGLLSPKPTPEPTPTPVPSLTAAPSASPTARPSASPAASPSAAPSASPSAPASPASPAASPT